MGNLIKPGDRFGRLVVTGLSCGTDIHHNRLFPVLCDCGNTKVVSSPQLKRSKTRSCGCLARELMTGNRYAATHGKSHLPEFKTWEGMIQRCTNSNDKGYFRYGGRGIKVCDRWLNSFENFLADMGLKPGPKYSIDREDNNGNYEPGNCRWATIQEQCRNRSSNKLVEFDGRTKSVQEWADEKGLNHSALSHRLRLGWSVERALNTPLRIRN